MTGDYCGDGNDWKFLSFMESAWTSLILSSFGLIGNFLSVVFLGKTSMRTCLTILLLFLAVYDLIALFTSSFLVTLPTILAKYEKGRNFVCVWVPVMLPFVYPIMWMGWMGSSLITLLVTLQRYLAVCKPLQTTSYSLCSIRGAFTAACFTTLFIILFNIPRFWEFYSQKMIIEDEITSTNYTVYLSKTADFRKIPMYQLLYLNWGCFIIAYGLPFFFLLFMNWSICRAVSVLNKRRKELMSSSEQGEIKLTKLIICITTASIVYTLSRLIWAIWVLNTGFSGTLWEVIDVLSTLNSSVNFVFYYFTFWIKFASLSRACNK